MTNAKKILDIYADYPTAHAIVLAAVYSLTSDNGNENLRNEAVEEYRAVFHYGITVSEAHRELQKISARLEAI